MSGLHHSNVDEFNILAGDEVGQLAARHVNKNDSSWNFIVGDMRIFFVGARFKTFIEVLFIFLISTSMKDISSHGLPSREYSSELSSWEYSLERKLEVLLQSGLIVIIGAIFRIFILHIFIDLVAEITGARVTFAGIMFETAYIGVDITIIVAVGTVVVTGG